MAMWMWNCGEYERGRMQRAFGRGIFGECVVWGKVLVDGRRLLRGGLSMTWKVRMR